MSKTVLLIGHCGPDNSYLRMAVRQARPDVQVVAVEDKPHLRAALDNGGVDLILFNRMVGHGFEEERGVEMIRWMKQNYPTLKMMLVSNFPEAQAEAEQAGALPGFGKRDIGTRRATEMLRAALDGEEEV